MTRNKKILIVVISFLVVIVLAVAGVLIYDKILKQNDSSYLNSVVKAEDITGSAASALKADTTTSGYTYLLPSEDETKPIVAVDNMNGYALLSTTKSFVNFQKDATVSGSEVDKVVTIIEKVLIDNGFSKSGSIALSPTILLRYERLGLQCQFSHFVNEDNTTNGFEFTCTDVADHSEDLALVNKLVGLWPKSQHFDYLIQDGISEDGVKIKSLNAINTSDPSKSHILLYAEVDSTWAYIADSTEGDPSLSNGKYIINDDLKKGLADAQYGPLLTKFLSTAEKK